MTENKNKKKHREQQIGFRLSDLLSPEEVSYARAESRGLKFEIDADAFVAKKIDHRTTKLQDISMMNNIIKNVKPIEIKKKEEAKEEAEQSNDLKEVE